MPKNTEEESRTIDIEPTGNGGSALARYSQPTQDLMLTPVFNIDVAKKRMQELQLFVKDYLIDGEDFGTIPGTPKPTLYKSGADKLCDVYGIADQYRVTSRVEDWDKLLFDYEVECTLISKRTNTLIATGIGSCNSYEAKYRYRDQKRTCPQCGKATIIKGREEYGGGWICWKKDGKSDGCGAKFKEGEQSIISQPIGRVQNEDVADQKNTLIKMAKKRAKIDAVLSATRSSGLFTQDMDDWGTGTTEETQTAARPTAQAAAQPQPTRPAPVPAPAAPAQPAAAAPAQAKRPVGRPPGTRVPAAAPAAAPKAAPATPSTTAASSPKTASAPSTGAKTEAPAPVKKTNTQRMQDIVNRTTTSTTLALAFMQRHLGCGPSELQNHKAEVGFTLIALEIMLDQFEANQVAALIKDDKCPPEVSESFVQTYLAIQEPTQ